MVVQRVEQSAAVMAERTAVSMAAQLVVPMAASRVETMADWLVASTAVQMERLLAALRAVPLALQTVDLMVASWVANLVG